MKKTWTLGLLCVSMLNSLTAYDQWDNYSDYGYQDCCDESGWFSLDRFKLQAEAIYWKATEDNLKYAVKERVTETITPGTDGSRTLFSFRESEKGKELDFRWKPGCRIRLDYLTPCDNWNVCFGWTHLVTHSRGHSHAPDVEFIEVGTTAADPTVTANLLFGQFDPFNNESFNDIRSHWRLVFNDYQWDFGRTICVAPCFSIRPFIGPKFTTIHQKDNLKYRWASAGETFFALQRIKTRYSGFGFQAGICGDWYIGCGFSSYSNVGGGITYGRAHTHEKVFERGIFTTEEELYFVKFKDVVHVARPNLDIALGLQWDYLLCDCYLVSLNAGWEYHHYFDQNFFRNGTSSDPARGSLSLHGVTFGAGINF